MKNYLLLLAASSIGKVLPNASILNFSNFEDFIDEDKMKKVLIIPFENSIKQTIGMLPEYKVLEQEKNNSEEDDEQNKLFENTKKKEKPLHSVSHEGSIGIFAFLYLFNFIFNVYSLKCHIMFLYYCRKHYQIKIKNFKISQQS